MRLSNYREEEDDWPGYFLTTDKRRMTGQDQCRVSTNFQIFDLKVAPDTYGGVRKELGFITRNW